MILAISTTYGYVLIVAASIAFECLLIGMIVIGIARRQVFTPDIMANFEQAHKRQVDPNSEPSAEGYPDMGNGLYSQRLSYANWYKFNNAQRTHYNFVQSVATIITLLLIGGIYHPVIASCLGLAYFIGRILYTVGYYLRGSSGRMIGVLVLDICLLALFVMSCITGINVIKGKIPRMA